MGNFQAEIGKQSREEDVSDDRGRCKNSDMSGINGSYFVSVYYLFLCANDLYKLESETQT